MFAIAVIIGRIVFFFGQFIGRSSNLPGAMALKICPNLFLHFKFKGKIIAVTGSNGKTTTANQIAHVLREQGYSVAINTEGSNMDAGIATTMLCSSSLTGLIKKDFLVLETDERYSAIVYKDICPDYILITNLFRDQVVRNGNPDLIYEKLQMAIHPETIMILNANDPITARIAPNNKCIYYGMDKTTHSSEKNEFLTQDCKVCPKCYHHLDYKYYHYNHIGYFQCKSCGYQTPKTDYLAENVDFDQGTFTINQVPVHVGFHTTFHVINTAAVLAVCEQVGVPLSVGSKSVESFVISKIRYDEMALKDGRKAVLMLTKQNPTSLDQSISYALEQPEEKSIVLFVNNVLYTDKKDISWLYDVTFERLKGKVDKILCTGTRSYDIAVRLYQGGFNENDMLISNDLSDVKSLVAKSKGTLYILAASAFGNEDGILEALK